MEPDHARSFGGGLTESTLSPYGMAMLIVCVILIAVLPRKYAALPLLMIYFLVPGNQTVLLGATHLFIPRLVVLAGLIQLTHGKPKSGPEALVARYNGIDSAFTWCMLFQAVAAVALFREMPAVINQGGFLIDSLGAYYVLRSSLLDREDVYRVLKFLAIITIILAVCMVIEQVKDENILWNLGGYYGKPLIREGKIRSQGPFSHTLTAGCFGATLLPLFLLLGKNGKAKFMGFLGIVGSTAIMFTSNSSTPMLAYAAGLFGIALWPIRRKMRLVRQGLVLALVGLHLVMKAPVWFLIGRVDLTGSSSGYHRALLVDAFIRHFFDWWLIGVKDMSSWGLDLWDAQNQFVNVGEGGGLLAFIFFIALISRCYGRMGDARKAVEPDRHEQWCFWFLGAAIFANITAFFGVNYFDQSRVGLYLLLAIISTMTVPILAKPKKPVEAEVVSSPWDLPQVEPVSSLDSSPR